MRSDDLRVPALELRVIAGDGPAAIAADGHEPLEFGVVIGVTSHCAIQAGAR